MNNQDKNKGDNMNLIESSMNFDSKDVDSFLKRIVPMIDSGFSEKEIKDIKAIISTLQPDQEKELVYPIKFEDKQVIMKILIVMDDINSPDIYFFSPSVLAEKINNEMKKYAEEQQM